MSAKAPEPKSPLWLLAMETTSKPAALRRSKPRGSLRKRYGLFGTGCPLVETPRLPTVRSKPRR